MKKILIGGVLALVVAGGIYAYIKYPRASFVGTLFSGAEQYQHFYRLDDYFPHSTLKPSPNPYTFSKGASISLPEEFEFADQTFQTDAFLKETDTAALLVLIDGKIAFEEYWLTGGIEEQWMSMSVAKSFVSALVGIAIDEGLIGDVTEPITMYVPSLIGSAYDGVRIKDILQMSAGAAWNEDYSDPNSDISRFSRIFALGGSLDEFVATLQNELEPGTFNRYNSMDTQALAMLVSSVTGTSVTDYMIEKLWEPMGAEYESFWILDSEDVEMAFGGFNATARDYAKLGELYRNGGRFNGSQIVPSEWVRASVTPDAPHLIPGDNPFSDQVMGYGYQWWIPDAVSDDYSAVGVYNQFVYVSPAHNAVIVKLSANSNFGSSREYNVISKSENVAMFKAILAKNAGISSYR